MSYEVVIPYDPAWEPLDWAKEHCPSYITNRAIAQETKYDIIVRAYYNDYDVVYYFSEGKDATAFALKWK
jgi:hypothetical protein